ncbi:MAG: glycogen synthase, partial [Betaproteobacteria bacterium]|nr:glycogen synthase [Betaproteobacteria bacterium]
MPDNADSIPVVFATPECAPLAKTGGLGDVSASLPAALVRLGVDVRILLPGYTQVLDALPHTRLAATVPAQAAFPAARILAATGPGSVPLLVLDCPTFYRRRGGPYQDDHGRDWPDNALRFGLLSRVAALLGTDGSPLPWRAQIVHCNDWQTGLAPAYLALGADGPRAASLVTVHNVSFQGIFAPQLVSELGLPASSFSPEGVEYYGKLCFLKAALHYADAITTVSPTHAREIQTEAFGFGMHGLLARRAGDLSGILNGIDTDIWNPAADALIARRYDIESLAAKIENKRALQASLGLSADDNVPLLGMVSRLAAQKGMDLVLESALALIDLPVQIAIQGVGQAPMQRQLTALARSHPGTIAVRFGFDERLAHSIEAGADIFLMPSRFEP